MSKPVSITVIPNGPLKISAENITFRYCGAELEVTGDNAFLCRCGESSNAPFCDGSHKKVGFVAEPSDAEKREIKVWEGNTLRTFFNPNICMHVFYCQPLKELRQRELDGDVDAGAEIARVVQSCPSGALTWEAKVEVPVPNETPAADIEITQGGEIRIQCDFEINTELQERQPGDRVTLCRCGQSKNKPWCDGRHKKRDGFK